MTDIVDKEDKRTLAVARKYNLVPGTIKCEVFALFDRGYSRREVRYILRDLSAGSGVPSLSNTIRRYYNSWKEAQPS